jgi:hypothetical protein
MQSGKATALSTITHPSVTPEEQWDVTSVNFIVKLPESHGHDAIMNIADSVSKQVHFIQLTQ